MKRVEIRILSRKERAAVLALSRMRRVDGGGESIRPTPNGCRVSLLDEGGEGAFRAVAEVRFSEGGGFSFFPSDAVRTGPVFNSRLGIAVTGKDDARSYDEIARAVREAGKMTRRERVEAGAEPTLGKALRMKWTPCPTFLTLPHNARLFELGFRGYPIEEKQHMELYDYVVPRINWDRIDFDGAERVVYRYLMGRGIGCKTRLRRALADGVLPVLAATLRDGGIVYRMEAFCDVCDGDPSQNGGTHYLEADLHSAAHVLDEEQQAAVGALPEPKETDLPVLRMRFGMRNESDTPKYAFLRLPHVNTPVMADADALPQSYDAATGFGTFREGVFMVARTEGGAPEFSECAWLLPEGGRRTVDVVLFFRPVGKETARRAMAADFGARKRSARAVWRKEMGVLSEWRLPEPRLERAMKAGVLQLRAACFGERGSDVFAPCVGVYSPIATESIAVVDDIAAFGDPSFAKKCVNYFFAKQRSCGFIQNMVNYMAETGGALVLAARIYRKTRDREWRDSLRDRFAAAVAYLEEWTERNENVEGNGRGMLDGQVADAVDPFHMWSLNGLAQAGLEAAGKDLFDESDVFAARALALADRLKTSILTAYREALIRAPLVPAENGEWIPLPAPWAESRTASVLHESGRVAVTHGSSVVRDSLITASVLPVLGLLDECGEDATEICDLHYDLFADRMVAFSQPYYCPVPYLALYRGERKVFLSEYYNAFATMADRETYAFWEHYFLATPHKTSEQGAFLLRTRMMLFYERNGELVLFAGIPSEWLKEGKRVSIRGARTAFGELDAELSATKGEIRVRIRGKWFDGSVRCVLRLVGFPERTVLSDGREIEIVWKKTDG